MYGILIQNDKLLITDENRDGFEMTKFVGGGLEFGEGLKECIKREFLEEMNIEITVQELFYTNEFLQVSQFNKQDQLHSFYYFVKTNSSLGKIVNEGRKEPVLKDKQNFRWINLREINTQDFTFPIDRKVVDLLKTKKPV